MEVNGEIYRVAGPVVAVIGIKPKMYDVVKVGHEVHHPLPTVGWERFEARHRPAEGCRLRRRAVRRYLERPA